MVSDDNYNPAERPPGYPGGDRIRFEREGQHEQSLFGGGAQDIEEAIMSSTERNTQLIGRRIMAMSDTKGALGAGTLQDITLHLDNGKTIRITGIGLEVEIT
jgi:hypothetical protein